MNAQDRVRAALAAAGGEWVDLPSLLPAGLVLELAGEDLRSRLFFASGPDGSEMCLRADLTIPAALRFLDTPATQTGPLAWLHEGKVFRAPRPGQTRGPEVTQLGLERFGGTDDPVDAECALIAATLAACAEGGLAAPVLALADGGLLQTVLDAADLPEPWAGTLRAAAHRPGLLRARLAEAVRTDRPAPTALEATLSGLDRDAARATVAEVLDLARLSPGGGREIADIADRMAAKARRAVAPPLDGARAVALEALLDVSGPPAAAVAACAAAAARLGVDLTGWAGSWRRRLDLLEAARPGVLATARFDAAEAGSFGYYDGVVFNVLAGPGALPAASGGRYDGLIASLSGGARAARAVGCVVRPGRLPALGGGDGA